MIEQGVNDQFPKKIDPSPIATFNLDEPDTTAESAYKFMTSIRESNDRTIRRQLNPRILLKIAQKTSLLSKEIFTDDVAMTGLCGALSVSLLGSFINKNSSEFILLMGAIGGVLGGNIWFKRPF